MMDTEWEKGEVQNCVIKLRENPRRRKAKVRVGCGAGFAGDRPAAALKLLQTVEELDYIVLECLAERTLADRYQLMSAGQKGYDPRKSRRSKTKAKDERKPSDQSLIPKRNNIKKIAAAAAAPEPAPSGKKLPLYQIAHSRAGDKGNDLNFSIIPHFPEDISKLKPMITPEWVRGVVSSLLDVSPFSHPMAAEQRSGDELEKVAVEIYEVGGISALNVVVRNVLDGGVNCSRRIDRHGKTVSDLILCQEVVLP